MPTFELTFHVPDGAKQEDIERWGEAVKALHELFCTDPDGKFCIAEGNIHGLVLLELPYLGLEA